jgi:glutaredoxin
MSRTVLRIASPTWLVAATLLLGGCGAGEDSAARSLAQAALSVLAGTLGFGDEEPAEGEAPAADDAERDGGVLEALGGVLSGDTGKASEPGSAGGFWRYTEPNGTLRFVQSFDEVPVGSRASAEHVGTEAKRTTAGRPAPRRKPTRLLQPTREPEPDPPAAYGGDEEVIVYTTRSCGWCRKTLAWLDAKGVDYVNKDVNANPEWAKELYRKSGGGSVPVIDVGGEIVRGYDVESLEELL